MISQIARMRFPLNVHALLGYWETGSVERFHGGRFPGAEDVPGKAPPGGSEQILKRLLVGGKILLFDGGFGELARKLVEGGWDVTGITPDQARIDIAFNCHGNGLPLRCSRLEDFREDEGSWDAVLFPGSGQHIAMLDLFERASRLLKENGEILILDQFARRRGEPGPEKLHHKKHFLALAGRFGFECLEELDLSTEMTPGLDILIDALEKRRDPLSVALGIDAEVLDSLLASHRADREKYRDGRFGHFLLHLKRRKIPAWRLGRITEEDYPAVNALFSAVFGKPLSYDFWRWKYAEGRGQAIGLWQEDKLIAHYGGLIRHFIRDGDRITGSQSCDYMVAPGARGFLVRRGPAYLVAATYIEHFVGYGTPCLVGYGFPNETALRLPLKLGLYTPPVTRIHQASWRAESGSFLFWRLRDIDPAVPEDAETIDDLWRQMSRELGHLVVGVRDASFWRARYREHPEFRYRLVLVTRRWSRKPLAVLALKQEEGCLELLDWVAARAHLPKVVKAARMVAAALGVKEVYSWVSEPVLPELAATSPQVQDLNILVPTNAWTEAPPPEILQDKLWLTGGDTDFH